MHATCEYFFIYIFFQTQIHASTKRETQLALDHSKNRETAITFTRWANSFEKQIHSAVRTLTFWRASLKFRWVEVLTDLENFGELLNWCILHRSRYCIIKSSECIILRQILKLSWYKVLFFPFSRLIWSKIKVFQRFRSVVVVYFISYFSVPMEFFTPCLVHLELLLILTKMFVTGHTTWMAAIKGKMFRFSPG